MGQHSSASGVTSLRSERASATSKAAEDLLEEIERTPHVRRSTRARLFYLHTKGLVERITLKDARPIWEEDIRLADELPDPLIAGYARVYFLENEIVQGRWADAYKVLGELESLPGKDARLEWAIRARKAYLESLCGNAHADILDDVVSSPDSCLPDGVDRKHGDLWERVIFAAALMEQGKLAEAEACLGAVRATFVRLRQSVGILECSLLLSEVSLRRRDHKKASRWLKAARTAVSNHDSGQGSRGAAVRIPFLEALEALQGDRRSRTYVADRLVDAAGNLPFGSQWETAWLLDLLRAESGESGAPRKLEAARERFVRQLRPEDRDGYVARGPSPSSRALRPPRTVGRGGAAAARRSVEYALSVREPARTRDAGRRSRPLAQSACGSRRGAIFVEKPAMLTLPTSGGRSGGFHSDSSA